MLIKVKPNSHIPESEVTDYEIYKKRREFIKKTSGAAAAFSLGIPALSSAGVAINDYKKDSANPLADELTEEIKVTSYNNFYELGTGKGDPKANAHLLQTDPWAITVEGECAKPGVLGLEDFVSPHQIEERIYRLRCVEAWSMVVPWLGVELGPVLKRFEPTSKAKYVEFTTILDKDNLPGQRRAVLDWPYREGLRIDEAMNPLTILAVGLYGKELPNQNGAPLRLVVPWKYGFKSIKSIVKIRFTENQPNTSWNTSSAREYGFYSNVNPEVDHPRWSQARERKIGELRKRKTLMFNGYADEVASLYDDMDLMKYF
ncbi:MAG: protein-methionine-sulfoxide reductase catalytic subunit MsrP [Gammaproteobacteria bacterium]